MMRNPTAVFVFLMAACVSAAEIRPAAMEPLPLGSVKPEGFILDRMESLADGLTGHAEELYDDIGKSDWLIGGKKGGMYSWERGPYYAKGLTALSLVLGNKTLEAKAKRWVDAIIASQRENGDFGPKNRNWWANMLALSLLRDWADARDDGRVVPFFERYFRFQRGEFAAYPFSAESRWAVARAGDELEVVLWLVGKTGKEEWGEFARQIAAQSTDWAKYYRRGGNPGSDGMANGFSCHIVNLMQGLKTPALQWRLDGDAAKRSAYRDAFAPDGWLVKCYGRPDRMLNGCEQLSGMSASEGTELCAVAERIASCQTHIATFADVEAADDLEIVTYNTLMSMISRDGRGITYYSLVNQPACVDRPLDFANNGKGVGSICLGPHSGFGCCRSNFHMAWPRFVQSMWMSCDGGLAAVAYGPCRVSTATATISESGTYPFGDDVRLVIEAAKGGAWPLSLKIPGWCGNAQVEVNGKTLDDKPVRGGFLRISREWKAGDVVKLVFPQRTRLSRWERDAVAVRRGPLLYALKMAEEESEIKSYPVPYENRRIKDGIKGFPRKQILPKSSWGYALLLEEDGRLAGEKVCGKGCGTELKVNAVRTDFGGWGFMRIVTSGRAVDPPPSPLSAEGGAKETVTLVPFGLTRIRVALFPWMKNDRGGAAP